MNSTAQQFLTNNVTKRGAEQLKQGVINPIELAHALDVKPQMIYQYIRNDKIKAQKNNSGKLVVTKAEAERYVQARLDREAEKAAKVEAELAGVSE